MRKYVVLIFLLLLGMEMGWAQQLVVYKKRHYKKYTFKEGEKIKIWVKDTTRILDGKWQYAGENTIIISGTKVHLQAIDRVSLVKKEKGIWVLRKGQDLMILVGLGLIAISQVNRFIQPEKAAVPGGVYIQSGRLIASGITCTILDRALRRRKACIGRNFGIYINPQERK